MKRKPVSKPLIGILAVVTAVGGALFYARLRWRAAVGAAMTRLEASRQPLGTATFHASELEGLPAPVVRYFRTVLQEGQPIVAAAHLVQQGELRMGEADAWRPFDASESFVSHPPGFLWLARVRLAPGIDVRVRDSYLAGAGTMQARVLGLFTMADAHDTPEMASGALQRFLSEALWFPTALLPSQGVQWTGVDDSTARATLGDGKTTVAIDFRFNDRDEITTAFTVARDRGLRDKFGASPWRARFADYAERDGMRIPLQAEAEWTLDGKPFPYWRGRVTRADYQYTLERLTG